jgi:fumarate hydratase class II
MKLKIVKPPADVVDIASQQSFPASDSPPWTLGVSRSIPEFRVEHDSMGSVRVPAGVLYSAQTQRAVENFAIGHDRFQKPFIRRSTDQGVGGARERRTGRTGNGVARRIEEAADRVAAGNYDQFVVDVFQTGSGTSTNMNVNEVIGSLADAHPNDEVNRASRATLWLPIRHLYAATLCRFTAGCCRRWSASGLSSSRAGPGHSNVIKISRTHLQDATPIRLGWDSARYAHQVRSCRERIVAALEASTNCRWVEPRWGPL